MGSRGAIRRVRAAAPGGARGLVPRRGIGVLPEQTKLRKIAASTFSQRAVAVYEHFITGLTEQVLDRMPASGETFDFVDAVAQTVAEGKVALAALARRAGRFELAGEPRRIRSNFTNGLKTLPVRIHS